MKGRKKTQQFKQNLNRNTPIKKPRYAIIVIKILMVFWFLIPIVLMRPFKKIYFASLRTNRIGHLIADTEFLLARIYIDQSKAKKIFFVIWIADSQICNQYVYSIWKQKIKIINSNPITRAILVAAIYIEKVLKFKLTYSFNGAFGYLTDAHLLNVTPTIFGMSHQDEEECIRTLQSNGIDTNKKWVCILARDNTYLELEYSDSQWDYNSYRNSDINTYKIAAEYLAVEGIMTFRMGVNHKGIFSSEKSNLIVDYANAPWRSEKLDIYLASRCLFFVSSSTGLDSVPVATRKPLVIVNFADPLHVLRSKQNLIFIIKYFYFEKKNKFLSLSEYYKLGMENGFTVDNPLYLRSQDLDRLGVKIIDNSEIEIKDAVAEMYESMTKGNSNKLELDNDQSCFWQAFPRDKRLDNFGPPLARIGKKFLEQNLWLSY